MMMMMMMTATLQIEKLRHSGIQQASQNLPGKKWVFV